MVCLHCASTRLKLLRLGVSRAREDLERLARTPVAEVTSDSAPSIGDERVLVGTEAVLHRADRADAVAFLDLDGELLAPRYRAAEESIALLARAARLLGGKEGRGLLLLQTRQPRHEVVLAAQRADPGLVAEAEAVRREALRLPPVTALAALSGAGAEDYAAALSSQIAVQVSGPAAGAYLVRARDHQALCDALAATLRPTARLRVEVDPLRA